MIDIKIKKEDALLVVIDFQERLLPAMKDHDDLEKTVEKLIKGCEILGVPKLVTQQYTKGLGATVPCLAEALGDFEPIEKTAFSAMGEPVFAEAIKNSGRKTIILSGIEAHVCVQQTALDLLEEGYSVFLASDCVSSRSKNDLKYAILRMADSGAVRTTCESILFELCGGAREAGFKEISALVK
ncbi:MAG: hydrolase [Eubacteriales bacterium]|nr:hydrolase [Eubacteriales bacterium]